MKSATGSYIRQAYGVGRSCGRNSDVNPFKYGIEAGTDFHSGLTSDRSQQLSRLARQPGQCHRKTVITDTKSVAGEPPTVTIGSGGLTGVWAEENTRAALFAAMKRKETFGTSGARIKVRMFAGWKYPQHATPKPTGSRRPTSKGVPMGGDLPAGPARARPTFARIRHEGPEQRQPGPRADHQGMDETEQPEKVYDVVWSGDRKTDPKSGKVPPWATQST